MTKSHLNKLQIILIFIAVMHFGVSFTFGQESKLKIEMKLKDQLDQIDSCLSFGIGLSSPTRKYDTAFLSMSYQQLLYMNYDSLESLLLIHEDSVSTILLQMLKEDYLRYSWAANLMLFYIHSLDATSIQKYVPNKCDKWALEERNFYIIYWSNRLSSD
jgi:hypothetical protein